MKNRNKDAASYANRCTKTEIYFSFRRTTIHKKPRFEISKRGPVIFGCPYFLVYITSLTSFTVLGTSGKAAFTRFPA